MHHIFAPSHCSLYRWIVKQLHIHKLNPTQLIFPERFQHFIKLLRVRFIPQRAPYLIPPMFQEGLAYLRPDIPVYPCDKDPRLALILHCSRGPLPAGFRSQTLIILLLLLHLLHLRLCVLV